MSQYIAAVPSGNLVPIDVQSFFERFYKVSDTPDEHEQYASFFTIEATLVMGSKRAHGTDGKKTFALTFSGALNLTF